MNILVTGSNGQLGTELKRLSGSFTSHVFFFTDVAELDITQQSMVQAFVKDNGIDVILNCAAYTAVDKAEQEQQLAYAINASAPGFLADSALKNNCLLVHVSTDYVYDGKAYRPYTELDPTAPESYYGYSKLAGEQAVINSGCAAVILRTSWLYSAHGANFVKTMRKYGKERGKLNVVFDQIGSPTWAADLANAIMQIVEDPDVRNKCGTYLFANEGVTSWYDFAVEILQMSGIACQVTPIETKDYPLPARRPHYSVLNKTLVKSNFGISIPHWKESLKKCIQDLNE
jgi:dTDP-4-dehydrorhamnose reductase